MPRYMRGFLWGKDMPIPSPADFRDRTKTNAQMREMLAELSGGILSKNYGYASIVGPAVTNINYTTADRKLNFINTLFIYSATNRYQLSTPQSVSLPANTPYRLQINTTTKTISAVNYTDPIMEGELILGFVTTSNSTLKTVDFAYAVDGVVQDQLALAQKYSDTKYGLTAKVSNSVNSQVTIDLTTKTLSFPANVLRITAKKVNLTLPATNVNIPASNGNYFLDYNTLSNTVSIKVVSESKDENDITFAILRKTSDVVTLDGIPFYNINGLVPVGAENGYLYTGTIASLNLDTVNKKLITASSGRVIYGSNFQLLPNASIDLPTANNTYRVELDLLTNIVQIIAASIPQKPMTVCFARIKLNASGYTLYGVDTYSINGVAPPSFDTFAAESKPNYALAFTSPSTLNFNFIENKIEITGNIWIPYNGNRILVAATTIELDPLRNTGYRTIIAVNPKTSKIVLGSSNGYTMPNDHIVIGGYLEHEMLFFGLKGFSVNGEVWSDAGKAKEAVSFGFSTNSEVNVDVADSYKLTDTLPYNQIRSSTVYGWYDALVAAYPDYVTKTTLGNDASGTLPIHQYRFKPKLPTSQSELVVPKIPKVMLITLHNEYMNFIYMHTLLREVCENWTSSEALTAMRYGVEFVVVPIGNPWGLDNNMRTNSNQVDVNRNFPQDWIPLGSVGDPAYSGTAALTESEAQHIYAAMQSEKPDIFYDCHSFGAYIAKLRR